MRIGKNLLINLLKIACVVLLLWWMAASGRLSWSQMTEIMSRPDVLVASIAVWLIGPVILGTARWWLLMDGAGLKCGYFRAMKLQLVGFFFNTAMPGAVGGDIIKAVYIMREQSVVGSKTPAMLSVLLDRIVGLIGLFIMGIVAASFFYQQLAANPVTVQLMSGLGIVVLLSSIFLGLVFVPYSEGNDPIRKILSLNIFGFSILLRIYDALRGYKERPMIVISTILISVVIQVIFLLFMGFIGRMLYGPIAFNQALLAPIFPFGILITAIPLAPGGLGVGHAAFDKLFMLVGLPGGANVFNAYVLSQLLLNLLGIIPYLSLKTNISDSLPDKVLAS